VKALAALGALLVAVGCSSSPTDNPNGTSGSAADGSATLHAGTHVVSQDLNDLVVVSDDKLVYPASAWDELKDATNGDILLGDRQSADSAGQNPDGYLRRVQSITQDAGTVVVTTSQATLQEAVDALHVQGTLQVPPLGLTGPMTQSAGAHFQDLTGSTKIGLLDFSGTKLLDTTGNVTVDSKTIGYHAFANITTGTLSFSPSYDVGIDLGFLSIKGFHATATGELDATLLVDAGVQLQTTLDNQTFTDLVAQKIFGSPTSTIADYNVSLGSLKVGPFNMPSSAHFTATLSCDFAWGGPVEVKVGGTAKASITAGIKYDNGSISPVFDKSGSLTQTGPNWTIDGATRAYCSIKPTLQLNFFGVASAQLTAEGYAGLGGSVVCGGKDGSGNSLGLMHGDAEAGVSATVLAKVDLLGLYKWQKECTLFDFNTELQKDDAFVLPGGSSATCSLGGGDYSLPPKPPADPSSCFGSDSTSGSGDSGSPIIAGTCTHDECTAGDKLGQQCDSCTMKVCAQDPYCCDTYWGLSCFEDVKQLCGKTCSTK
jgi:hypothetical protein